MLLTDKLGNSVSIERQAKQKSNKGTDFRQRASGFSTILFWGAIVFMLYKGWQARELNYLTAESGLGYGLGIVGGSMMLALLVYPLRKRIRLLRFIGSIKHWFRIHMIFGVLGPTLILYHCNFGLGALNSNVALLSMLIVAASGLLGRYFYTRIHHGLYGTQATIKELQQESHWLFTQLADDLNYFPQLQQRLQAYELAAFRAGRGWFVFITIPWLGVTTTLAYMKLWFQCKRAIRRTISDPMMRRAQLARTRINLSTYFSAVRKVAEFSFYARIFSAWHVLHLPLFVMMLFTGIIHVIAVHMY